MKVGNSLIIKLADSNNLYRCKVIDMKDRNLIIDHPIDISSDRSIVLPTGATVTVTFFSEGFIYEFTSKIIEYTDLNVPAMLIPLPPEGDIRRIQRREFVRIQTNTDVAIHCPKNSFQPFTTVTADISGGGALIVLPPNKTDIVTAKEMVEIYLVLRFEDEPYSYIRTEGEVILVRQINNVHTFSVKFHFDSDQDQEKIIRYCFEVQRRRRQDERLITE